MTFLQMSITGASMILMVTVIRSMTISRLPKRTFLALWSLVVLRLLIPFSIPSVLSIYSPLLHWLEQPGAETARSSIISFTIPQTNGSPMPQFEASAAPSSSSILFFTWIIGCLACAGYFTISSVRYRREFNTSLPVKNPFVECWRKNSQHRKNIQVRQFDRISSPLTYGIWKPTILLPPTLDWKNERLLQYVLLHEEIHIRRLDSIAKLILTAAFCVHWFNPLVWVMYVLANRDLEISCDEAVVRAFGESQKSEYAFALIAMEENKSASLALCNNFSKNAIEERIRAITRFKPVSTTGIIAALVILIGTAAAFATTPIIERVADSALARLDLSLISKEKMNSVSPSNPLTTDAGNQGSPEEPLASSNPIPLDSVQETTVETQTVNTPLLIVGSEGTQGMNSGGNSNLIFTNSEDGENFSLEAAPSSADPGMEPDESRLVEIETHE